MMNETLETTASATPAAPAAPGWGRDLFALALRVLLAAVFIYSAWHKIADPFTFMEKVHEYEILPAGWVETFSYVLPWAMAVCSGLLILGLATRAGAAGLGLMLLSFIAAIAVNIYKDRVLGCGCFSEEGGQIGPLLLAQDFSLLIFTLYLALRGGGRLGLDRFILRLGALAR